MKAVNLIMEVKEKEESGMEQAKKNCSKPWAHTWTKLVLEIIHYHKWPVRRSLKPPEEISQIGQCNQEPNLHGSQEELLTFRAVTLHHPQNILQLMIEILETKYFPLGNSNDSICHQVLPESKNRCHTCIRPWLMDLRPLNQKTINSKK